MTALLKCKDFEETHRQAIKIVQTSKTEQKQLTGLEKVSQALQKAIDAAQTNKAVGGEDAKYSRDEFFIKSDYEYPAKNDIFKYVKDYEDISSFERDRQDRLRSLMYGNEDKETIPLVWYAYTERQFFVYRNYTMTNYDIINGWDIGVDNAKIDRLIQEFDNYENDGETDKSRLFNSVFRRKNNAYGKTVKNGEMQQGHSGGNSESADERAGDNRNDSVSDAQRQPEGSGNVSQGNANLQVGIISDNLDDYPNHEAKLLDGKKHKIKKKKTSRFLMYTEMRKATTEAGQYQKPSKRQITILQENKHGMLLAICQTMCNSL